MASSSLQADQLAQGLPVEVGGSVSVATQQHLPSSSADALNVIDQYALHPIVAWSSCVSPVAKLPSISVDLEARATANLPSYVPLFADVSQGSTNMCTSLAFAQAYSLTYALQHSAADFAAPNAAVPQLSAMYAYYFQRTEECATAKVCACPTCSTNPLCKDPCAPPCVDCGSFLRSAATVYSNGVCISAAWPFDLSQLNVQPSATAIANAALFRVTALQCVDTTGNLAATVATLLQNNTPVVVFLNMSSAQVAWMEAQTAGLASSLSSAVMPPLGTSAAASVSTVGHVVLVDGYDASRQLLVLRNNYGFGWGYKGRFCIAAADFTSALVHTMVVVQKVCGPPPTLAASIDNTRVTSCVLTAPA